MLITSKAITGQKILSSLPTMENIKDSTIITESQSISSTIPHNHRLFGGSSYDRYLDILLDMWPKIKEKFPDATLDLCYGWELFDKGFANNPERMAWKEKINAKMKQPGITHHGRVGKEELTKIRQSCGIWAYPTYFTEINCITALDAQSDGLVPVTMDFGALKETVGSGIKIKGDIYDHGVKEEYLASLLKVMGDEKLWKEESVKAREFVEDYKWPTIAERWINEFA